MKRTEEEAAAVQREVISILRPQRAELRRRARSQAAARLLWELFDAQDAFALNLCRLGLSAEEVAARLAPNAESPTS